MTKNQLVRRINELRREGLTFRAIEVRLTKSLKMKNGPGNGTKAFRLATV